MINPVEVTRTKNCTSSVLEEHPGRPGMFSPARRNAHELRGRGVLAAGIRTECCCSRDFGRPHGEERVFGSWPFARVHGGRV